ncbi:MAG: methanogenesis marker 6 protein [Candidatus Helarchaeota archaeon]|nr:methanogenesis marker 6 protein [Candidatus Helarchaeota archaeon]
MDKNNEDIEARIYILGPYSRLTPAELLSYVINLRLPIKIKETCFGIIVEGKKTIISKITSRIRSLDKNNIFTRMRGFPPGDPRICRATSGGGPRYGFHFLEFEHSLLPFISEALNSIDNKEKIEIKEIKKEIPLDAKKIKSIIEEMIPKK